MDFIINPNASNGRCGKVWMREIDAELRRLGIRYREHRTRASGDAVALAQQLARPYATLVSVGGDGTHNEIVGGLLAGGLPLEGLRVGFLTLGTGGDLRKTLGLPTDPLAQLGAILSDAAAALTRPLDVGRLTYTDHAGVQRCRGFVNIASFGIGGEVDDRVNRTTKALGGFASFLIGTMRATIAYRNRSVRLKIDGQDLGEQRIFNVAVANGQYFGGGMHVAPNAKPDDGLFDVVVIGDIRLPEVLISGPRIYRGTHLGLDKVWERRARFVEASSDETVLLDVDGEQLGRLPATFEVVPEAIRVLGVRGDF